MNEGPTPQPATDGVNERIKVAESQLVRARLELTDSKRALVSTESTVIRLTLRGPASALRVAHDALRRAEDHVCHWLDEVARLSEEVDSLRRQSIEA